MLPLLAVPAAFKLIKGIAQEREADSLRLRDTTPEAFKEQMALAKQGQAAALPGAAQQEERVDGTQESTLAAGTRAGTSASSILGLLSESDRNRQRALADLDSRQDAFHQQQNGYVSRLLSQQAQYQLADQQTLDRNKAALREAGNRNEYSALDEGTQVAAYGMRKAEADAKAATGAAETDTIQPTKNGLNSPLINRLKSSFKEADDYAGQLDTNITGPDTLPLPAHLRRRPYKLGIDEPSWYKGATQA